MTKKITPVLIMTAVLLMISMLFSFSSFAADTLPYHGDINRDGAISAKDLLILRKGLVKLSTGIDEDQILDRGDMNGDGKLNAIDVLILRKLLSGNLSYSDYISRYEHVHDYKVTSEVDATCTEDGYIVYTCSCGDTYTTVLKATGHSYVDTVTAPTCTEQGYTVHECSVCGDSYTDSYTDALGHDYGEWETVTEPTTESEGLAMRTCTRCGDIQTKTLDKLVKDDYSSVYGVDLSCYQGTVDWDLLSDSISFVMLRMSYDSTGVTINGVTNIDKNFSTYYTSAKSHNLKVGCYWFMYDYTESEATGDAKSCVAVLKDYPMDYPVVLDVEEASINYMTKNGVTPTKDLVSGIVEAWCDVLEKEGYTVMLYTNYNTANSYLSEDLLEKHPIWLAQWPDGTELTEEEITSYLDGTKSFPSGDSYLYKNAKMWQFGSSDKSIFGVEMDVNKLLCDGDFSVSTGSENTVLASESGLTEAEMAGMSCYVNEGALTYDGVGVKSFVYGRVSAVKSVSGDRVVVVYNGTVVGAFNTKDITLVLSN